MKVPKDGAFMKISSVFDIYKQVRLTVAMVCNVWSWSQQTTTLFRLALPGLVKVYVGGEVFTIPGFLLQELEVVNYRSASKQSHVSTAHPKVSNPLVQEVHIDHPVAYFKHIILLMKLRWLLRLHSACCELDYKMCSLRNLILGIQFVVLQQHEEVQCDSLFDTKVSQHIGSHLNIESLIDDIADQLQRALGSAWRPFLEYVASCDPTRSVHYSRMESRISTPQVLPNDTLAVVVDTIFLAHFLRLPHSSNRLRKLYHDLESLGVPLPDVPPLQGAQYLDRWAKAKAKPTLQDRQKCSKKDAEKLAQLDAVLLTAAVELHLPEIIAGPDEANEELANVDFNAAFPDSAPGIGDMGATGKHPGSAGPSAARVIMEDKQRIASAFLEIAVSCVHHHHTFPDGLRERLYGLLVEEYGLTKSQLHRLAIGSTQNIDGNRLPESTLLGMEHREKVRLRMHQAETGSITTHLLQCPLAPSPLEKGNPPKHVILSKSTTPPKFGSTFSAGMTRSLPDLKAPHREAWKVPMITGPLTRDPDLGHLRTTGFFIRMPPLKGGNDT